MIEAIGWRRAAATGLAVSLAGLVAGCGSNDGTGGSLASEEPGKALFAESCGGCHTLKAAGTTGTFGPNLDKLQPTVEETRTAIRIGPGAMPEHILQGEREQQVAEFVGDNAGNSTAMGGRALPATATVGRRAGIWPSP
jgi:cytochrome c6